MIDASHVARILGISSEFIDLRSGVAALLPQHIVVIGQGSTAYTYPSSKFLALSMQQVATRVGPGSQLAGIYDKLRPVNGDGVGSIPITMIPLTDHESGTPATGAVAISAGTATKTASYRIKVGGVPSAEFVIPKGTIDVSYSVAKAHDALLSVYNLPAALDITYGTVTETSRTGTGNGLTSALSAVYPALPGDYVIRFTSEVANGGEFSFYYRKANGSEVLLAEEQLISASPFTIGGVSFALADGSEDFDVDDEIVLRVPATAVELASRSAGQWANAITLEVEQPEEDTGVDFVLTEFSGGAANPDVDPALLKIGNDWATMVINAFDIDDTDTLEKFYTWGEGRWGSMVHRPAVVFTGNTYPTVELATAVCSQRRYDRINSQLVAPGSIDLPYLVAARQVARIARVANNNPPVDYGAQPVYDLTPGDDEFDWDAIMRDAAVKLGSSTVEKLGGRLRISDVVTFYRPEGEDPPGYRYVVDIVRSQNIEFGLELTFGAAEWAAAPLIADNEPTVNRAARKRKAAVAAVSTLIDGWADAAIITDRERAKASIDVTIGGPKRLNIDFVTPYSGNTNIKDVRHKWGFVYQ